MPESCNLPILFRAMTDLCGRCACDRGYASIFLEKMCELRATDIFVSTYYTTPLRTPSLSVVYDMIPERLDCDLNKRAWREKELAIAYGRRHLCMSERARLDLLEFYPELDH